MAPTFTKAEAASHTGGGAGGVGGGGVGGAGGGGSAGGGGGRAEVGRGEVRLAGGGTTDTVPEEDPPDALPTSLSSACF